jgi:hypothetical protein
MLGSDNAHSHIRDEVIMHWQICPEYCSRRSLEGCRLRRGDYSVTDGTGEPGPSGLGVGMQATERIHELDAGLVVEVFRGEDNH